LIYIKFTGPPMISLSRLDFPLANSFRFIRNHLGRGLIHFELGARFLDLRSLLFELGCERLYLLLLLRDRRPQVLNFLIEHGLLGSVGNGLGLNAFG
jgi:hypothetical protein